MTPRTSDIIVVGAGHNGLVAAILLARSGLAVTVLEEKSMVGGAVKTERPFTKAPGLATSTGAYLLGVMPPELIAKLGIRVPTFRRDPHLFSRRPTDGSCSSEGPPGATSRLRRPLSGHRRRLPREVRVPERPRCRDVR